LEAFLDAFKSANTGIKQLNFISMSICIYMYISFMLP